MAICIIKQFFYYFYFLPTQFYNKRIFKGDLPTVHYCITSTVLFLFSFVVLGYMFTYFANIFILYMLIGFGFFHLTYQAFDYINIILNTEVLIILY